MVATPRSFEMIAMLIVGGEGTLVGGLAGAALLTLLPIAFQPIALYKTLVEGAVLILAFQYLPDGIVGGIWRVVGRLGRTRRPGALAPETVAALDTPTQPQRQVVAKKTPALEAAGLAKRFGGLQAVADVSFAVPHGSITALIGPNGAGKTTVFNLITNLFPADRGEVRLYGRSLRGLTPGDIAALGLLRTFQTARVLPGMTTLENLLAGAHRQIRHGAAQNMLWLPSALPRGTIAAPARRGAARPGRPRPFSRRRGNHIANGSAEAARSVPRADGAASAPPARRAGGGPQRRGDRRACRAALRDFATSV